jgi:hypothetical protein
MVEWFRRDISQYQYLSNLREIAWMVTASPAANLPKSPRPATLKSRDSSLLLHCPNPDPS